MIGKPVCPMMLQVESMANIIALYLYVYWIKWYIIYTKYVLFLNLGY